MGEVPLYPCVAATLPSVVASAPHTRARALPLSLSLSLARALSRSLAFSSPRLSLHLHGYRGTSLIRNSADSGPCSRAMPRALWWS